MQSDTTEVEELKHLNDKQTSDGSIQPPELVHRQGEC